MRITPLDVRKQEFRRSVRGFDCDEVRAFLTTLADEYETVLVDNKQIRERLMEQEDKIGEYKTMERTLRDTLMTAEKLMQESKETAGKECDVIISAAHQKAKSILEECRIRTEELRREIVGLRKEKETYLARFKGLAESQIAFIEAHRNDFADLDKRLVDLVDSVVDGTINSETENRLSTPAVTPSHQIPQATETAPVYGPAPQAPAQGPQQPEVDMWRDYKPETAGSETAATTQETVNVANIDMATMEIANPHGNPAQDQVADTGQEATEETDAIAEAITATLSEEKQPEPQGKW
jgi:cell division initiation protein